MSNREQVSLPLPAQLREYVQRLPNRWVALGFAVRC
jgi:hypothetical protein